MADEKHAEGHADKAGGKMKEGAGKLTGNKDMENEGKADQAKGDLKKAVGDVKDAFKK